MGGDNPTIRLPSELDGGRVPGGDLKAHTEEDEERGVREQRSRQSEKMGRGCDGWVMKVAAYA